ncbi:hypothetical protein POL68_19900 [Stigmatella sp. ncwal1]|uniref:Phage major capsid protein n=1 Tax=Stigmatella ashevillensis TaxID=2995309 RepID=A0ABT5DCC5_9BACT|nr:hypothetical protein [Stigmatella ashevillena]MDC0710750.1 hypothetical protein [Stigmatella ashevillena]
MSQKSKNRANGKNAKLGASFEQELGPLVKAIDEAVLGIPDEQQRQEVRQLVGEAVHGALRQLAVRSGARGPVTSLAAPVDEAVNAIKQVQSLGFVEFTTGLINGTFDAIIAATLKQMDAYAQLVADLAKTLTEFKAENVTEGQITAHLAINYPDGVGGTSVSPSYTFTPTAADPATGIPAKTANQKLLEVAKALEVATAGNKTPLKFTGLTGDKFTEAQVNQARSAVGEMLAISMIEHLRAMAREGMARIVITDGELLSKLTFNVTATAEQTVQKNQYQQTQYGGSVRAHVGFRVWGASASAYYNTLNISTVNETSHDKVTMNAEIIGMVKLRFKTETFAPIATDGPIE